VISTFIVMKGLGFTLNILTLMGLSLAIGLLIDDAIVVRGASYGTCGRVPITSQRLEALPR
jgi:multidrug efflux pump subunit AcrB